MNDHHHMRPTRSVPLAVGLLALGVVLIVGGGHLGSLGQEGATPTTNAVSHSDEGRPSLLDSISEYSRELQTLRQADRSLREHHIGYWIERFETEIERCDDPMIRQHALVAVMSLHNEREDWELAEMVCTRAIDEAPDAATRLERLGDLYAILAADELDATGSSMERSVRAGDRRGDLFGRMDAELRALVNRDGLASLGVSAWHLYRWAAEEEIRRARAAGDPERTSTLANRFVRLITSRPVTARFNITDTSIRYLRADAIAGFLGKGDPESAYDIATHAASTEETVAAMHMAYSRASDARYADRAALLGMIDWARVPADDGLLLAERHARSGLRHLASLEPDDMLVEGQGPIEDDDVIFAFMILEDVLSRAMDTTPDGGAGVTRRPSSSLRVGERRSLKMLIDFLRIDGQTRAADQYARLLNERFSDASRLATP